MSQSVITFRAEFVATRGLLGSSEGGLIAMIVHG